jgi:anthranilate synthase component II
MILLLDNYDSFVHNLARYFEELGTQTLVVRNDATTVHEIRQQKPQAIVLSPGPCTPLDAGITLDVIRELGGEIPILGVCLGHQAIGQAFGARICRATQPMHGRTSLITHTGDGVFRALPQPLQVMRYHSLVIEEISPSLRITARTDDGVVMGVEHVQLPIWGVQFHPESVLTTAGHQLLSNFLDLAGVAHQQFRFAEYQPRTAPANDFYQRSFDPDAGARP